MLNVPYNNDLVKLTLLVLTRLRPYFESNLLSPKRLRLSSKKGFTFRSTLSLFDLEINQRYRVVLSIKHRYESYETHTYGSLPQPAERRPKQLIQKTNLSNPRPIEISVPVVYYIKHWYRIINILSLSVSPGAVECSIGSAQGLTITTTQR